MVAETGSQNSDMYGVSSLVQAPRCDIGSSTSLASELAFVEQELLANDASTPKYHIVDRLGKGGMGAVYKALQRQNTERIVAIKLVKIDSHSKTAIGRFEVERHALTRMAHENIAKLLEAGTTRNLRPYFVMEYVAGKSITSLADEYGLRLRERLLSFLDICAAIDHVHSKGIIHGDIKSDNVLGVMCDGKPRIKVIDFGLARALDGDPLNEIAIKPVAEGLVGTPEYMSPEQLRNSNDVDMRSDVYSLGVVLYELLTGLRPFHRNREDNDTFRRRLLEQEPPQPTTQLRELDGSKATAIAVARQMTLGRFYRKLDGELSWIMSMAMHKERAQRYSSPRSLAEDISNYLRGRPLVAGPNSATYRVRKLLIRKIRVVGATAVAPVILIKNTGITLAQRVAVILTETGASIGMRDGAGLTPLQYAVCKRRESMVRFLIAKGAALNARDRNGWTALHWATFLDNGDIAVALMDAGAEINAVDSRGSTPLIVGARNGSEKLVKLLLERLADSGVVDLGRQSAAQGALANGWTDVAKLIDPSIYASNDFLSTSEAR